jgi:single-strand DNA-binding protein
MNLYIGIGRITKDHELKLTDKGLSVMSFSIAITRDKENTDFINCVAFGKTAELLNTYTGKGSLIAVEGWLRNRSYEKDGKKVYATDVIANKVQFLDNKKNEKQNADEIVEDLPF